MKTINPNSKHNNFVFVELYIVTVELRGEMVSYYQTNNFWWDSATPFPPYATDFSVFNI